MRRLKYISRVLRYLPPETPGKARLARRLLGSSLQSRNIIIKGRDGATFLVPSLREPIGFYLLVDGVYEVKAIDFALERMKPGSVFIDVGANIGAFAIPAALKVGPKGCVIAIEPSPQVFPFLKKNVALNGLSNVRLIQCAAFNSDGQTVPFYEAPVDRFGMGSLGSQFEANPVPVLTHTLDYLLDEHMIGQVDVIKVDVEGFEAAVFRGAEKILTGNKPPVVVFEFCDWAEDRVPGGRIGAAQRALRDWGYRIWRLDGLLRGNPPLAEVLTRGFEILVAIKNS
ncbi:MAG: FkbM family methyltransferase [Acidobacteria bacterium]|nr:FkbM family methyltransferase [Acidobacteriota bacterium]